MSRIRGRGYIFFEGLSRVSWRNLGNSSRHVATEVGGRHNERTQAERTSQFPIATCTQFQNWIATKPDWGFDLVIPKGEERGSTRVQLSSETLL